MKTSTSIHRSLQAGGLAGILLFFLSSSVFGANNYWIGGASGDFTNAANWSAGTVPTAADAVYFTNRSAVSVAVNTAVTNSDFTLNSASGSLDMNIASGTSWMTINTISIGSAVGSTNTLSLTNGGSALVGGALNVGAVGSAVGTILVSGGQLVATNSAINIFGQSSGNGTLTQTGGNVLMKDPVFGNAINSLGTLNLSGGTNQMTLGGVGPIVGYYGGSVGTVMMTGGQLVSTNSAGSEHFYLGCLGVGNMTVSNGVWLADYVTLGSAAGAKGTLTIAGGTTLFSSKNYSSSIGDIANATGTVLLTGGQLVTTNIWFGAIPFYVGNAGVGSMTVSNGVWLGNTVNVGNAGGSRGTLTLAGGTGVLDRAFNIAASANATGTVLMTGGQLVTTNSTGTNIFNVGNAGVGSMTVSDGVWLGNALTVGNAGGSKGTLTFAGGTNVLSSTLSIAASANATGTVLMTGGQLVTTNSTGNNVFHVGNAGLGSMTVSNGVWLGNAVNVGNASGSQGTLTFAGGTSVLSSNFNVGASSGATGTVWLTSGQLVTTNSSGNSTFYVGNAGRGTMMVSGGQWLANGLLVGGASSGPGALNIDGGTSLVSTLSVAYLPNVTGTVVVTGGQLVSTNTALYSNTVGQYGKGTVTQSGGSILWNDVVFGNFAGSLGTFNLSGGTNQMYGSTGTIVGYNGGAGTVMMTGGQLVTTNSGGSERFYLGLSGVGTMTVSNGIWLGDAISVLNGTLTLAGGTNMFSSKNADSYIGNLANATGNVLMTGGQLVTTNIWLGLVNSFYVGNAGVGNMTVSNGQWLANSVTVGGAATGLGTLNIDGGQVVADRMLVGGVAAASNNVVRVTHGGVLEANSLSITAGSVGNMISNSGGVYQFSVAAPSITNASGVIALNGGTLAFRGIANADVKGNWSGSQLTNILFSGNNTFRLNAASNSTVAQDYTFGTGLGATNYVGLEMINGATAWRGGNLTIGNGGTLLVSNTSASIAGVLTNSGTMTVMNSRAIYQGNVVNLGAYVSDPSTNTFNGNFTVGSTATVVAASGDIYAFGSNFVMQSTNRAFDMSLAKVVFADAGYGITTGDTNHTFSLAGSGAIDKGSNWVNHTQLVTNFSIGTLTIASGNRLTLTGDKGTNALYVGVLDLSAWATNASQLTNTLEAALSLNINLYYDKYDANNAYLQGVEFDLWGPGNGLLIPIPEPGTLTLILAASALSVFIMRRKDRRE